MNGCFVFWTSKERTKIHNTITSFWSFLLEKIKRESHSIHFRVGTFPPDCEANKKEEEKRNEYVSYYL